MGPDNQQHPVAFYSSKLWLAEHNYTTRELECLALKELLSHWRHYLLGCTLSLTSYHESLKYLHSQKIETMSTRLIRWSQYFSLFNFENIEYLPRKTNVVTDFCSHPPTEVKYSDTDGPPQAHSLLSLAMLFDAYSHNQSPLLVYLYACIDPTSATDLFLQLLAAQQADTDL